MKILAWWDTRTKEQKAALRRIRWSDVALHTIAPAGTVRQQVMRDARVQYALWDSASMIEQAIARGLDGGGTSDEWATKVIKFLEAECASKSAS